MSEEQDHPITPDLLSIFDANPEVAEAEYQRLRIDLTRSLEQHGCHDPDGVTSEAIYRGLMRIRAGVDTTGFSPRRFIWGVAKRVAMERIKVERREQQLEPEAWTRRRSGDDHRTATEARQMLNQVRRLLTEDERRLLLRYAAEKDHTAQCAELDVTPDYLRVRVFRLRKKLKAKALSIDGPHRPPPPGSRSKA